MPTDDLPLDPRQWLAAIVDCSDDAIVSKTLDGIVTTWNAGAQRLFGYTREEMVGRPILKIIPADRLAEEPQILQRLRRGERVDHFETVRLRKDGTLVEISVTISPVRDASGTIVGASKIARDISAQKRFEAALIEMKRTADEARAAAETARDEAESANRAKDHFLSILSHELRTPLTPALGAISLLENDQKLPQALREQIVMIRRNVETEARLVDDLLDLTRFARGKLHLHPEVVDVHALLHNTLAMFQAEVQDKELAVTLALRAKQHHVWADPGRFQQILLNLMSNAVKFTPAEGAITLRTANADPATTPPTTLEIEVSDTGVGFDPEIAPHLFRPFEQGEQVLPRPASGGGLGLGLSIVKALIEMHGGRVTASSPGRDNGAVFRLTVPAVDPAAALTRPAAPPAALREPAGTVNGGSQIEDQAGNPSTGQSASPSRPSQWGQRGGKQYKILLVEDHADTRHVMSLLLKSFGCDVTLASTVREAVALAEREKFDLLVSDLGLPDGTGLDVVRQVSQRQPAPFKAIAISGFGQDEDLRRSREAGFDLHLTKPINLKALEEALANL